MYFLSDSSTLKIGSLGQGTIADDTMVVFSAVQDPANVDDDTVRLAITGSVFDELNNPNGAGEKTFKSDILYTSSTAGPEGVTNGVKRGTNFIKIN